MFLKFTLFLLFFLFPCHESKFREIIKWKQITYKNLPEDSSNGSNFIQYNNVPQGFDSYEDRIFVGIPRRNWGIPSTLNFVRFDGDKLLENPPLESYPDYETNELDFSFQGNPNKIVSVYRPRVDECERLWFIDTGLLQIPGSPQVIQRPSIWVMDLKTDRLIKRYEIPASVVDDGMGTASITVDVVNFENKCEDSYAYIPDFFNNRLIVYSLKENKSWAVKHNYFMMNPPEAEYNINGINFTFRDGIFSITLGQRMVDFGHRQVFFHPLSSNSEFAVSTRILRNETLATRADHFEDFELLGNRGNDSQSTLHGFDLRTRAIFFASIVKSGISCWNLMNELSEENVDLVFQNNETLFYPSDLKVDFDGNVWAMSNRMPRYIFRQLDTDDFNFRIFKGSTKELVQGTKCSKQQSQGSLPWSR